jgi:signal transduction histidine kinase
VAFSSWGYVPSTREQEYELFRIAQEALHNVAKHASARTVELSLDTSAEGTVLRVRDDGTGFDSATAAGTVGRAWMGLGLRSMRERAESLGARFSVQSTPGQGTVVEVFVPAAPSTAVTSKDES